MPPGKRTLAGLFRFRPGWRSPIRPFNGFRNEGLEARIVAEMGA
jgi:hypothetical protein